MLRYFRKATSLIVVVAMLAGCATSPQGFRQNKESLSDATLCRTAYKARDANWDLEIKDEIAYEMIRRNLTGPKCQPIMQAQTAEITKDVMLGVAAVALLVVAAKAQAGKEGPMALCRDGTYSYSQTHSGTCSHHGGVWQWYR